MNRRPWTSSIAPALFLTLACQSGFAAANTPVAATVEALLTSLSAVTRVPAYSVAIVHNGELAAQAAVGETDVRNHTPADVETWFRLASVSKVVGSTMLGILVQEDRLDPDAPIATYLHGLPEQYQAITTLELLAHTSGLPHYQPRDARIAKTHYADAIATLASVGDRSLLASPGTAYRYSTHGYTLLGAVHEAISGRPLEKSLPEFINALTGQASPALENIRQRNPRRSNVFNVTGAGVDTLKPRDQSYSPFGTGMIASASDLALFGDAVLHSPQISSETRELLFRPVAPDDGSSSGNYLYEVAFGWRVGEDASGRRVYHHAGVTEGARSVLVLYPDEGLSIAFLSNASWTAQIERTAFALGDLVLERQTAIAQKPGDRFTGTFDGQAISGMLDCDDGSGACRLSDGGGALSTWLNQYRPAASSNNWPVYPLQGDRGRVLKMVTSVGYVELREVSRESAGRSFQADIGSGRRLEIRFHTGDEQARRVPP